MNYVEANSQSLINKEFTPFRFQRYRDYNILESVARTPFFENIKPRKLKSLQMYYEGACAKFLNLLTFRTILEKYQMRWPKAFRKYKHYV